MPVDAVPTKISQQLSIAVVGGTGPQGRGLAYRMALAGHRVVIGSRDTGRASATASEINERIGDREGAAFVTAAQNAAAVEQSDIALLAIPWNGHEEMVSSLASSLFGKIVISCVNPLGFDERGPYGLVLDESAAEEVQRLIPTARVVGAFHHVAAASLWKTPDPLSHEDVLVCGDDDEAKRVVMGLAAAVTGKTGIDGGSLHLARQLEPLTAVLISMNKRYKTRSGIAITGVGVPA